MGPGIFTRHAKKLIGGILLVFLAFGLWVLYGYLRSPVGGPSPYEQVNGLIGQEQISFTLDRDSYSGDVEAVEAVIRNGAADTVVAPARAFGQWCLEKQVDGVWRSMRLKPDIAADYPAWEFPPEEYGPHSTPSGVVMWNGGEQRYLCRVSAYYRLPLEEGEYRIVFPDMEHENVSALAAEFEVV